MTEQDKELKKRIAELEKLPVKDQEQKAELAKLKSQLAENEGDNGGGGHDDGEGEPVQISARLPESCYDALGAVAKSRRLSRNQALVQAVEQYTESDNGERGERSADVSNFATALAALKEGTPEHDAVKSRLHKTLGLDPAKDVEISKAWREHRKKSKATREDSDDKA